MKSHKLLKARYKEKNVSEKEYALHRAMAFLKWLVSLETFGGRRQWGNTLKVLREKQLQSRIL